MEGKTPSARQNALARLGMWNNQRKARPDGRTIGCGGAFLHPKALCHGVHAKATAVSLALPMLHVASLTWKWRSFVLVIPSLRGIHKCGAPFVDSSQARNDKPARWSFPG